MTYTETNTSGQTITFLPGPYSAFTLTHNGAAVFLIAYPQSVSLNPVTWAPGQSFTETQTWDGLTDGVPPAFLTGTFVVGYGPEYDPDQFTTTFQVEPIPAGALATSVTTDRSVYEPGQAVNLTFMETNVSDQPVTIVTGTSAFQVMQDGTDVWDADPGTSATSLTWTTLQPGQSYTQTDTWDGLPNVGLLNSPWSPFTVSNGLDSEADSGTFQFAAPTASQLATSLTTDQSVYQLGAPIQMTFTQTNVGTQPIQVLVGTTAFEVQQDGTEIWGSEVYFPLGGMSYSWETLQPGQSATQVSTWNGVPDQLPSSEPSGIFTATNAFDPRGNSATLQIDAPSLAHLAVSLTTDQSVYDIGAPVPITFTETNEGSQPITILTGPTNVTTFDLTQGEGGPNLLNGMDPPWSLPSASSWKTLQPGQSYTQPFTWSQAGIIDNETDATGTFVVSNFLDSTNSTATFQILSTPYSPPNPVPPPADPTPPPVQDPASPTSAPPSASSVTTNVPTSSASTIPLIGTSLSTNHRAYRPGERVRIALTVQEAGTDQTAASNDTAAMTPDRKLDRIMVLKGSRVVWQSRRSVFARRVRTLHPGETIKLSAVWNGRPNQPGTTKLTPGTYTIAADVDGHDATTTITIEPGRSNSRG